jgi:hypothetical protein
MKKKIGVKKIKRLRKGIQKFLSKNYCYLSRTERLLFVLVIKVLGKLSIRKKDRKKHLVFLKVTGQIIKLVIQALMRKLFSF